jgi:hypothetical protein
MTPRPCPFCHARDHLLEHARPYVLRRAVEAAERGPGWGLIVGVPDECRAENEEEAAELVAARERGHVVWVLRVTEMMRMIPHAGHDINRITAIVAQLSRPPPADHVPVVGGLRGCFAYFAAPASRDAADAFDAMVTRDARGEALLRLARKKLARLAPSALAPGSLFVAEPNDEGGVRVEFRSAADALRLLPLDDVDDGELAARRILEVVPGCIKVVLSFEGGFSIVSIPLARLAHEGA